ncbi:haloacid dehalogenase type II [Priestia endophytica]|uniref:haloacid dehalogenase type II n=1 Tax=Priestia endophytica TaxID=135735 RepID=UPI000F54C517|nr:haloacid dehalogenase type II [Priestia endophytica]RPK10848.1 2-haloalkanoic acid dehalogenase [Priestia endophytica]
MSSSVKGLIFDVYGTLFDVHSVETKCDTLFKGKGKEISTLWHQKQIEYSFLRQLMGQYKPFSEITLQSLKYALNQLDISYSKEEITILMETYKELTPYTEVEDALQKLAHKKLIVFSNGSRDMLEPLIENSPIARFLDMTINVDDIKQYKPTPASYTHALNKLNLKREEILFLSSNGWDISGAKSFGFQTSWINRTRSPIEEVDQKLHYIYQDLNGILALV